jgi:nucleoside-triphosphatase THEP1
MLVDKVRVDLHMLRALMLHGIGEAIDCVDVVAVDEGDVSKGVVELVE